MNRVLACFTLLVLIPAGAMAALSADTPPGAVLVSGLPVSSGGLPEFSAEYGVMPVGQPFARETAAGMIRVAGRFNKGVKRNASRGGGIHKNVNVNRNVNVNARRGGVVVVDDDDDNEAGAAIVGGLIGLGVGAAIANSNNASNSCSSSDCGY